MAKAHAMGLARQMPRYPSFVTARRPPRLRPTSFADAGYNSLHTVSKALKGISEDH